MSEQIIEALELSSQQADYLESVAKANDQSEAEIIKGTIDVLMGMAQRRVGNVISAQQPYCEDEMFFTLPFEPSARV